MSRRLDWDGCFNVRDLGGVPVEGGGETRYGAFVRADDIGRLTEDGWAALAAHGVTRVVDLRWDEEASGDPPRGVEIDCVRISLLGELDGEEDDIEAYLPDDAAGFRGAQYADWLDRHRAEFGRVFSALAAPTEGTTLFHCVGGKDRTGLVAALLLRLAGATTEEAAADYALSAAGVVRGFADYVEASVDDAQRARRAFRLATPREAMERALAEVGEVEEYLRGAGVSDDEIARLEERLGPARA